MARASASGKSILLGEHAVVYGRPAIAVPVSGLRATVEVTPVHAEGSSSPEAETAPGCVCIVAQDLGQTYDLDSPYADESAHPLQVTVRNTLQALGIPRCEQALRITIHSQIPIARGLGSGAAVATALVRALTAHFRRYLTSRAVSDLVFQTELILHGTPSGVDNTVVAYEKPVYFIKGEQTDVFWVGRPFHLVIADTGVPSKTRDTVAAVRERWLKDTSRCEGIFDEIADAVTQARQAIATGEIDRLGDLMNRNHLLLQELDVSSPGLDGLVAAALRAGAAGAKLSGGGRGGCIIALVDGVTRDDVCSALLLADAESVMATTVA